MADLGGNVRQRRGNPAGAAEPRVVELQNSEEEREFEEEAIKAKRTANERVKDDDDYKPWVDVLRVLTFLILASAGISYLVSNGKSFTWGVKHSPKYLTVDYWKSQLSGPIRLTVAELAQYDGTDESKPIYLAINGTIFDVSANRRTYGPGGSYNVFAGRDASRAFVTGCMKEDRTADLRGVEDMFMPRDDAEVDRLYTAAELVALKEKEMEVARQKVHDALAHWTGFFASSPKYSQVGVVKREPGWMDKEPRKKLCQQAEDARPQREVPERYRA